MVDASEEALAFPGGSSVMTDPSSNNNKWIALLHPGEAADVSASLRGSLISSDTLRAYSRPKELPGLLNFEEWLQLRPVPVHDVFLRDFNHESRALLFSGYLVALKNGEAGSYKGRGMRGEQIVKIVASIKFVYRSGFVLADGAPNMAFFKSQMVLDIIKGCARTEEEFRAYIEEKKAQAKVPWNWHLMSVLLTRCQDLDRKKDEGWSSAADLDVRCASIGSSLLFDVGCRPGTVSSPDGKADAHHTIRRDQAVAYRFEPDASTGAPAVLQGYAMGPAIYWLGRKEIVPWSIGAAFLWAALFVKLDIQILTTKTVGGGPSKAGAEGIAQPVTLAARSSREAWLKNNMVVLSVVMPGHGDQDFFTRIHVPSIGDVKTFLEGPLPSGKAKGIRMLRAKDITACMRIAATSAGFEGSAFSAKSMRSGRQSDCYHRGVPENASLPVADLQRGENWKQGSSVPGSYYTALLHGRGEFALATDDIDWSVVGREDTESMLVRRVLNQAACAKRGAGISVVVAAGDTSAMPAAKKGRKKVSKEEGASVVAAVVEVASGGRGVGGVRALSAKMANSSSK